MVERCVDMCYETIRRCIDKIGGIYAKRINVRSEARVIFVLRISLYSSYTQ